MAKFRSVRISDIYKETKDCSVMTLDIPEDMRQDFAYIQGQHLTFRSIIDGEDVRRTYSLCSSPAENKWQVAVKRIDGGRFSSFVNEKLKPGDTVEVMPPTGVFYAKIEPEKEKNYIAFAAGSGITPVLSIMKTHLALEPKSTFKLFYLNRSVKSIIFKEEIEQLKNKYLDRLEIFHFLTKENRSIPLLNGRFTHEKMEMLLRHVIDIDTISECFICGPEEMIFLIRDELQAAGLPKEKIHFELFSSGHTTVDRARANRVIENKAKGTEVTIIDGGKEFHFTMDDEYDNILDGALAAGADLPFACKGGVCSTCRCKVVEGSVEMKINYALDESDIAKNYVLSCQAVPTSSKVIVDFGN